AADKGEGLFFAGANHVAINVVASEEEHKLVTTNPEEVVRMRADAQNQTTATQQNQTLKQAPAQKQQYKPVQNIAFDKYETIDGSKENEGLISLGEEDKMQVTQLN